MTTPTYLSGNRFRAYRSTTGLTGPWIFVCLATAKTLTQTNEFEDATANDCDDPTGIPNRKSVVKSRSWGGRLAGKVDAARIAALRTDAASESPVPYQFLIDKPAASGGGTYTGAIYIESFEETSTDNGFVSFTAQFRGDDALVWAPAT